MHKMSNQHKVETNSGKIWLQYSAQTDMYQMQFLHWLVVNYKDQ